MSLEKLGVRPEEITDVILTHLHFDHAGGSTYRENGELKLTFPNARHYVQKAHWQQALNPTEKDRGSFMPDDYMPLQTHAVLEFTEGECEIAPGISLLVMNGHTASQQLPLITDGKQTVLFSCDLFPTTAHIPLPYIMAYDLRPLTTLEEKKRILRRACDEDWTLFFEHDPHTIAGKVKGTEKGFAFDRVVEFD